jgi:double-stranded uracil-DNA glycosylase
MTEFEQENRVVPELPDILSNDLDVVFCGINPGMRSAERGYHFSNRSNRFWRVLHLSGFTSEVMLPEEAQLLLDYRCGLTSAVARPTVGASDLKRTDFLSAIPKLEQKIRYYQPRYIAFLGKPAYSAIVNQREVDWGKQPNLFAESMVWVLPNPSGLNCAFRIEALAEAYRELRTDAGMVDRYTKTQ